MKPSFHASSSGSVFCGHKRLILSTAFFILVSTLLWNIPAAPPSPHVCNCGYHPKNYIPPAKKSTESWCSSKASARGLGQNVISYSLFTAVVKYHFLQDAKRGLYKNNLHCNVVAMRKLYPGWIMRIYTDYEPQELCDLSCQDDVDVCDVRNLPHFGNFQGVHPMVWRFLALGDPTVRMFMIRDADNGLSEREKFAVDEWIKSNKPFHGMRDHPYHNYEVMGCAWGGNNELLGYETAYNISTDVLNEARAEKDFRWGQDQEILTKSVYNKYKDMFLNHDSYTCSEFKDSVPFPVQREPDRGNGLEYMGMPKECRLQDGIYQFASGDTLKLYDSLTECPVECRPPYGMDWKYC